MCTLNLDKTKSNTLFITHHEFFKLKTSSFKFDLQII